MCRYASIIAIESPFKEDDQQWLTYWVLYSFITLLELGAGPVFAWYYNYTYNFLNHLTFFSLKANYDSVKDFVQNSTLAD
jgi:hypothetical protein